MALNEFGRFLRAYRAQVGMLLYDMAKDLNVGPAFLSGCECDRHPIPEDWKDKLPALYPDLDAKKLKSLIQGAKKSVNPECELYSDSRCSRDRRRKCKPSSLEWLDDSVEVIEPNQMCCKGSIFGNYYIGVTEEQLEALKNGKVLFTLNEYGIFIGLRKDNNSTHK